jgi:O-antigen/teichoic acid export membrane protein
VKDHVIITAGNIASRFLGLVVTVVYARALGPEYYGKFTIAFTVFVLLTQLGVAVEVLFLRGYGAQGQGEMSYAYHFKEKMKIGVGVLTGALVLATAWWLLFGLGWGVAWSIVVIAAAVLSHYAYGTLLTVQQAAGQFAKYAKVQLGWSVLFCITAVTLVLVEIRTLPVLLLALWVPSIPWAIHAVRRERQVSANSRGNVTDISERYSFAFGLVTGNILYAIYQRLDVLVLGAVGSMADVGVYGISVRFYTLALMASSSLSIVTQAQGANPTTWYAVSSRKEYLRKAWVYCGVVVGMSVVVGVLCEDLIRILFGPEYVAAVVPARILLLAPPLVAFYMPYYYYYYAMAMHRRLIVVGVIQLAVIAAGLWLLVPHQGASGAATAMVLGYLAGGILVVGDVLRLQATERVTRVS